MYEIIQVMSTYYFLKQYISLVSLDLIVITTVTIIENYRDRSAQLISMDFERRKLIQLVQLVLHYIIHIFIITPYE